MTSATMETSHQKLAELKTVNTATNKLLSVFIGFL